MTRAKADAKPARTPPRPMAKEDGRALRSATTRRAVAEAYLNLLSAGDLRPTAKAIALEAKVSERAVFRHFQDMENLYSEAAVIQIQRVTRELPDLAPATASLADRASALACRWCTLNERVTPVRRVALLHEPFAPEIARRLSWVRGIAKSEIESSFAGELGTASDEARPKVVAALAATTSWETWNEMRQRHGLGIDVAMTTIASMLVAIVTAFPLA